MDFYRPPALQGALDALGSLNRALRAWKFYPPGHPVRRISVKQAHAALLLLLDGNNLSLNCGRTDFSFPDGEALKDTTRMSSSLSYELFIRRVRKITFLKDVLQEDLLDFLRLLTIPPDAVQKTGGMDKLMVEHGNRTIWINEFDLTVIHNRRRDVELTGKIPLGLEEIENDPGPADVLDSDQPVEFVDELRPLNRLYLLLGQLSATLDEEVYLLILRQAVDCADALMLTQDFAPLFPLVELLTDHVNDPGRVERLRECARFGLEQLVMNEVLPRFLLDHIDQATGLSYVACLALLRASGRVAVNLAVEKMGVTNNLAMRKTLSTLLVGLGEIAVPPILQMMGDTRWYIVRNLSAILGDIGTSEAIPELQKCLKHPDIRVSKEAIRSLAKIGGRDAEAAIIDVLRGNDPSLFPQVVTSLGGMKSRKSLVDLMHIVCSADLFLNYLPLKINALAAIAMIGDRQVVPVLADMLSRGHIVVPGRWKLFKIAIAGCLARLGDARALPNLKKMASATGELGRACAEAAESIEQRGKQHGVA